MSEAYAKSSRLIYIYSHLVNGEILNKAKLAEHFNVTPRSIQRDMDVLRCFFSDEKLGQEIIYDPGEKGYKLIDKRLSLLTNNEILAVCKILLESRSMIKEEMEPILDKLVDCCIPIENYKAVKSLISNEKYHYIEPHHGAKVLPLLWDLGSAIKEQLEIDITYQRIKEGATVSRRLQPVGLMFSEYYFYLVAYIADIDKTKHFDNPDDSFPTIYRVDRIKNLSISNNHFSIPYGERFEEGEFRKRVQFMYGGKLQKIRFKYTGTSIEAILDRLPSAYIADETDDGFIINAEVFGKGIDMWLRSQGEFVKVLP